MDELVERTFTLNGKPVAAKVDPKRTLLRYLREDLRMVGTKDGCTSGDCGSCAVLVDGKRQDACTYLMRRADGVAIETIEGLASPEGKLHPIQAAYLETGGTQCGFCTPGMIMATKALLQQHPDPSEQEIREGLKDNICRCTGYVQIFEAVQQAAEWMREPRKAARWKPTAGALGSPATLVDGHLSVTGRLPYADDLFTPNMLFGAIHWSAHPYAKILSIDVAEAKAAPGVVRVIGAADVPGLNAHGRTVPDQPVFCFDYVRFVGDPIVCVLAETREQAERDVEHTFLTSIVDPGGTLRVQYLGWRFDPAEMSRAPFVALLRTPSGFSFAPVKDGEIMAPEEFAKLSEEEQRRIQSATAALQASRC